MLGKNFSACSSLSSRWSVNFQIIIISIRSLYCPPGPLGLPGWANAKLMIIKDNVAITIFFIRFPPDALLQPVQILFHLKMPVFPRYRHCYQPNTRLNHKRILLFLHPSSLLESNPWMHRS